MKLMLHASKVILILLFAICFQSGIAQVTLTATVGTSTGSFTTLKGAFDAINAGTHKGVVVIKINSSTTESATAALNASGSGSASYTSINIYPTTTGLSISGALALPLINLNGADNVIIDGRVNETGSTKSLTITNTSTSSTVGTSTIRFIGDASTNTIQYCNLKGSSTNASSGILFFSTATTTGNDNNTITYNDITCSADASRPLNAIYALGTSAMNNDNNTISNNNIYNFLSKGTASQGINISSYNSGYTISDNSFYETATFTATGAVNYNAILINAATGSGNGFTISGNYIGGSAALCAGTAWTKTAQNTAFTAISVTTATGTANSIQGNTIQNFNWTNDGTQDFTGIYLSGATVANIGNVTGNTIGAATGTGSISFTSTTTGTDFWGIEVASTDVVNCQNNTIGSITVANASTNATNFYGIYKTGLGTTTISHNTIGSTSTANSINASAASSVAAQSVYGILSGGTGTVTISSNTISNMANATSNIVTGTTGAISGINVSAGTNTISNNTIHNLSNANANNTIVNTASVTGIVMNSTIAAAQTVSGNAIYNLSNSYSSFTGGVIGIYYSGSTTASTVKGNFIYGLSVSGASSTTADLYGIKIAAGATTYSNNIISLGGNTTTDLFGIYQTGAASNNNSLFYNTVYLSGSLVSGSTNTSYALYSTATTNTRDFRNNIFVNARSTVSGASKHYAMYIAASGGTITCNYNNYYVSGTGGVLGFLGADVTALPIVTSQDANSINTNPSLSNAGGTTASDYIPTNRGTGVTGTGVTDDYFGYTRGTSVSMGAYEAMLPPSITSFSPTSAKPGDAITLTGAHFNATAANNIVFFGATQATVTAASTTSLSLTVPTGATFAPISVLNTGTVLSAATLSNFNPVYNPAKASISSGDISSKVDFTTGSNPYSVAIGDLDGDGKPDLAVANYNSATVSVFRNTSTSGSIAASSFAAKVDFTTSTNPSSVAIGDLDGDGKPELAVTNNGSNTVSVFRNTSTSGSMDASSFAAKVDFTTGIYPRSVAIGDLDGDGKPDLAVANNGSSTVSVFRNTSTSGSIAASSFAAKVDFTTGLSPYSVAIGDLDGDGKPDLAVANYNSNTVSVFLNTATSGSIVASSFAAKVDFTTGSNPYSVAIGDLDGDGKPDLAVANGSSATVSVFHNTSTSGSIAASSFAAKVDFTTGTTPYSLTIGDLDGDGKPDLAVANNNSATVSVFRNTSTSGSIAASSFAAKVDFTTGSNPLSVAIGDLDGDGKPDLAVANYSSTTVSVFRNADCTNPTSGGTIAGALSGISGFDPAAFTSSAAASGYSGTLEYKWQSSTTSSSTGFSDIASSNSTTYDAGAVTQSTWFKRLARVSCKNDWTGAVESNVIIIYINPPPPVITSFSPIAAKPGDAVTLTGIRFNTTAANNIVFFGATQATVTAASATSVTATVPTGATYGPISLLDIESSGSASSLSDFNPVYNPAKATIGTADISAKVDFTTGTSPRSVAIGDLDGDGKPDLAVANYGSATVSVFRNTSTSGSIAASSFAAKVDFTTGTNPYSVAIGDLDGDGKPDLAVANYGVNKVSVFRNTSTSGSISFDAKVDFTTGLTPYSVAIGDLDGDGKPDLAVANYSSNTVSVFRNTSTSGSIAASSFAAKVDFTTGSFPVSVAIGDLDGDGKPDLSVANNSSNTVSVFHNTSTSGSIAASSFAAKVDFTTGSIPRSVAIGDLDGDGKPDLAVANYSSATVSVFLNTSTSGSIAASSFATKVDFTTGSNPISVAIGDLDGDGKPDLSVANNGAAKVSVFRNTSTSGSIAASSFAAKVDFTTGTSPYSVAIGDLDGDGKPDLAVANNSSTTVSVFRNADCTNPTSGGTIAGAQSGISGFDPTAFTSSAAASGNSGTLEYKWQSSTTSSSTGFSDIASINSATYDAGAVTQSTWFKRLARVSCKNDWTGAVESNVIKITINPPPPVITSFSPIAAKPGDAVTLTGIRFNTTAANNIVFFGATQATVTAATATSLTATVPTGATYGPISLLDIESSGSASSLSNFNPVYNPAKSSITTADISAKVDFTTGTSPQSVAIGDLDGDGKPDLAVANNGASTVSVFHNTSTSGSIAASSFAAKVDFTTGSNPRSVAIGDLDGDGKPDLAVANYNSATVSVFLNTSTSGSIAASSFATKVDFTTGNNPYSVAIGDLDGDGKPDLAVANNAASTVSVFHNTSTSGSIAASSFAAKVDFTTGTGTGPRSVAIGDLDGDGKPDLAVANYNSATVSVFRNTSTSGSIAASSFATKVDFTTGSNPYSVAIGDLDGDGKPDLAVTNGGSATVSVFHNTSTSGSMDANSFAATIDFTTGSSPYSVAIGDLDGDGKPDLAVANYYSTTVSVFRNTSTSGSITASSFAANVDFTTGSNPISVAIGDLDGDGKPDLSVANYGPSTVSVLRNADVTTLPVTITQLQASKQQLGINLDWKAENEISVDKYIIERSTNGIQFEAIGSTTALGNNGSTNVYRFIDALPSNGKNYYRIKAIDKSGAIHYTNIVFINLDAVIAGIGIYPNPISTGSFMLKLQGMSAGQYSIQLLNNHGQQIMTKEFKHWGGSTTLNVHLPTGLSTGMYFIRYMKDNVVLKNEKMVVE